MKHTHGKAGSARAHKHALTPRLTGPGAVRRRHFADPTTGTYRGKALFAAAQPEKTAPKQRTAGGKAKRAAGARAASKQTDGAGKAEKK